MKDARIKKEQPNAETQAALAEYDAMKHRPEDYKRYDTFDDALKDFLQ
jgi:DNA-damage-inducible protein J